MTHNPPASDEDVQALMTRVREKSALICKQQHIANTKGFEGMGGAMGLQKLQQARKALQAKLPPLVIVS